MTEFTPKWIAGAREVVGNDAASPSGDIAFKALDEISRLQARVTELEAERKVYCTADGDYPAIGLMTIFEDYAETYIGGFDDGYWFDLGKKEDFEKISLLLKQH